VYLNRSQSVRVFRGGYRVFRGDYRVFHNTVYRWLRTV